MERDDLHWKRFGSVDELNSVICRLGQMWPDQDMTIIFCLP